MQCDVFLCYSRSDYPAVQAIAARLRSAGIEPWIDTERLVPGQTWLEPIEQALRSCEVIAVFVGPSGPGPWQQEETRLAIDRQVIRGGRVIPVLLPGAQRGRMSEVPSFLRLRTWVDFSDSLENDVPMRLLIGGIKGSRTIPEPGGAEAEGANTVCPYRGLRYFDQSDAPFYFGREALTEWLLEEIHPSRGRARTLSIVGASGTGKSSLARAGLLASLAQNRLPGSAHWPLLVCRPGQDPLTNLALAMADLPGTASDPESALRLADSLRTDERVLQVAGRLAQRGLPPDCRFVLLVDPLEEVLIDNAPAEDRTAFIRNLLYPATVPESPFIVVVTVRNEFLGIAATDPLLAAALSDHQRLVGPLSVDELRRAIEAPAKQLCCSYEPGLVDLLIQETQGAPGSLPLLQHVLTELWNQREEHLLTHRAYATIGRLAGALERHAQTIFEALDASEQRICRRIMLRLTNVTAETAITRGKVPIAELIPREEDADVVTAIIGKLAGADARLLTVEGDRTGAVQVEIAHDTLIRSWSLVRDWIEEDRSNHQIRQRLSEDAKEWGREGREEGHLYLGNRLRRALQFAQDRPEDVSQLEDEFLGASLQREEKLERQMHSERQMSEQLWSAREVQQHLFPRSTPARPRLDVFGASALAAWVNGDYYDFLDVEGQPVLIIVADAVGRGAAAALLVATLRAALYGRIRQLADDLAETVADINRFFCTSVRPGIFVTMVLLSIDPDAGLVRYVRAGHEPPLIMSAHGEVRRLDGGNLFLGFRPEGSYQEFAVPISRGDVVCAYTDGVSEARNSDSEEFGEARITTVLRQHRHESAKSIGEAILRAASDHVGEEGFWDDRTVVVVKIL